MTRHALLVETNGGTVVAVIFGSLELARRWEDEHELTAVGCVPIVNAASALALGAR